MKVWVAFEGEHDYRDIVGVYATEALAVASYQRRWMARVEEWRASHDLSLPYPNEISEPRPLDLEVFELEGEA